MHEFRSVKTARIKSKCCRTAKGP